LAISILNLTTVIMEFTSAFISFLIGYYAMKAYRASSSRALLLLYWGFIILGVGIFLRVFTASYIGVVTRLEPGTAITGLINLAALIYSVTQLIAYALFVAAYVFQTKPADKTAVTASAITTVSAAVFPLYRLFFIPSLELIAITMLAFVAVSTFINWRTRKNSESALVFYGFFLMMLSHVFFLFLRVNELLLFVGEITQLAGFICLITMLAKVSRTSAQ